MNGKRTDIRRGGKALRMALALLCCAALLAVIPGGAGAVEVSKQNWEFEHLRHCNIMTLKTNQYTADRPVIIFFPGKLESGSIGDTAGWIRKYALYENLEADIIAAAFRSEPLKLQDWKGPVQDLLEYLREKHREAPFPIIADAVSASGYAGCYLAELFNSEGLPVKEVNLADACIPGLVTDEWITEIAAMGTQVNIWACTRSGGKMSDEARRMATELNGKDHIRGEILDTTHGQVLHDAIYTRGVHSEYQILATPE